MDVAQERLARAIHANVDQACDAVSKLRHGIDGDLASDAWHLWEVLAASRAMAQTLCHRIAMARITAVPMPQAGDDETIYLSDKPPECVEQ